MVAGANKGFAGATGENKKNKEKCAEEFAGANWTFAAANSSAGANHVDRGGGMHSGIWLECMHCCPRARKSFPRPRKPDFCRNVYFAHFDPKMYDFDFQMKI